MTAMHAAPTPAPPPPVVGEQAYPPATSYMTVWVYRTGVALVNGQTGWLQVLKTDAAILIAAGNAVDPYTVGTLPYITSTPAPTPSPPPGPAVAALSAGDGEEHHGRGHGRHHKNHDAE